MRAILISLMRVTGLAHLVLLDFILLKLVGEAYDILKNCVTIESPAVRQT
jgi:hypothetical protein